jgi:hypothetical protein
MCSIKLCIFIDINIWYCALLSSLSSSSSQTEEKASYFLLLYNTKAFCFNLIQRTRRDEQGEDAKLRDNSRRTGKTT